MPELAVPEGRRNERESVQTLNSTLTSHSPLRMNKSVHLSRAAQSLRRATKTARAVWTSCLTLLPREQREELLILQPPGYLSRYRALEAPPSRQKGAKRALDRPVVREKELPQQVVQDRLAESRSER
jgi:hypothetical protein